MSLYAWTYLAELIYSFITGLNISATNYNGQNWVLYWFLSAQGNFISPSPTLMFSWQGLWGGGPSHVAVALLGAAVFPSTHSRCSAMAGPIQFLDITVDDGQPEEGLSRILKAVKPHWDPGEVCRSPLVGGCINAMYCCHTAQDRDRDDAVLVRINRGFLAESMDRNKEFLSMQVAQAAGCHAPLYAVFNNGLVYKYVPGRLPSLHDLQNPKVIRELARALFRLHQTDITSVELLDRKGNRTTYDKTVDELSRMKTFTDAIPSRPDDPDLEEDFRRYRADFTDDASYREIEFVVSILRDARLPLSFVHGDIHKNNMLLTGSEQVAFIDFEGSAICYRYFDLGYFFVMWRVSPWVGWCQPGEPVLTPEVRRQYLEAYLEAKCEHEGRDRKDVSPEEWELMDLQHQVIEFATILDYSIESLAFINEPSVPATFLQFHPEAKDTYFKLKGTIGKVIARIQVLDKIVNGV